MKKFLFAALALLASVALSAPAAQAGTIDLFAESAQFSDSTLGCTKATHTGVNNYESHTLISCTPGAARIIVFPLSFPTDASNTGWTFNIAYESDNDPTPCQAEWRIRATAFPDDSTLDTFSASVVTVSGVSQAHVADIRYVTPTSAGLSAILDASGPVSCASSDACRGNNMRIVVEYLNDAATPCNPAQIRMVHVVYPAI